MTMSPEEGLKYLALFFLMGGGLFVVRPIVTALARRIAGDDRALRQGGAEHDALADEVRELRQEMAELQERVDFAERLLAKQRDGERLGPGAR